LIPGGVCPTCRDLKPEVENRVKQTLTSEDVEFFRERILRRRKERLKTFSDVPKSLRRQYADCKTGCVSKLANAKDDRDELRAHVQMATLKSVLVKPLSAGKQKKKKNKNFTGAMLKKFIAGKHQECWEIATKIESRRRHLRKKRRARMRKLRAQPPRKREKITRTIYARAAGYAQDAEYRRAVSLLQSHGVADPSGDTLNQLRGQHPERRTEITAPSKEWVAAERARYKDSCPEMEQSPEPESSERPSLPVALPHVEPPADEPDADEMVETPVPIIITGDDILASSRFAQKGAGGGLDQDPPWLWRRACENSPGNRLGKVIARVANRALRGHYSEKGGEFFASCRLIALYKDPKQVKVRPIGIGLGLRRLISKTITRVVRAQVDALLVVHNQLGVMKAGFEVGLHSLRVLAGQCEERSEVIFLNDYKNAFNLRDLMLKLVKAPVPEIHQAVSWLYAGKPELITSRGDTILSEEGAQQGDPFANTCFGLLNKHIDSEVLVEGLRAKMYFWDDSVFTGKVKATIAALKKILSLEPKVGLPVRLSKVHFHAPNFDLATQVREELVEAGIPVKTGNCEGCDAGCNNCNGVTVHDNMELTWMKVPVHHASSSASWRRNSSSWTS